MKKKMSGMIVFELGSYYGADDFFTNIQNVSWGQIQKDCYFMPEGILRDNTTSRNKEIYDSMNSLKGGWQGFQPGRTAWSYLGFNDIGMTAWKQICGKWFCFKVSSLNLPDSDSKKEKGSDNSDAFDNVEENRTQEADERVEAEKKTINCPNKTGDDVGSAMDNVSTDIYKDEDRVKGAGNAKEAVGPWNLSHEYEFWCSKMVEKKYNKSNNMEGFRR